MKMKNLALYAPFSRVDSAERIVGGFVFVNETVQTAAGPITWDRAGMQRATADYMQWANLREMHEHSAVGTVEKLEWDDQGRCYIEARVVDDAAWKKVEQGVYKGLSARIRPKRIHGRRVTDMVWFENSLVDRPADPDAKITLARVEEGAEEAEVEVVELHSRGAFADIAAKAEVSTLWYSSREWLGSVLYDIRTSDKVTDKRAAIMEACSEFGAYIADLLESGDSARCEALLPEPGDAFARFAESRGMAVVTLEERAADQETISTLTKRAEDAEAGLETARAENSELAERVKALEDKPVRKQVVGQTHGVDREFLANQRSESAGRIEALRAEYKTLTERREGRSPEEQLNAAHRIQMIKHELASLGERIE